MPEPLRPEVTPPTRESGVLEFAWPAGDEDRLHLHERDGVVCVERFRWMKVRGAWKGIPRGERMPVEALRSLLAGPTAPEVPRVASPGSPVGYPATPVPGERARPTCDVTGCVKGPGHYHEVDGKTYYYPKTWEPEPAAPVPQPGSANEAPPKISGLPAGSKVTVGPNATSRPLPVGVVYSAAAQPGSGAGTMKITFAQPSGGGRTLEKTIAVPVQPNPGSGK